VEKRKRVIEKVHSNKKIKLGTCEKYIIVNIRDIMAGKSS